eukprot:17296_1
MIESKPTKDDLLYNPSSSIVITWGQFFVGVALYVLSYYLIDDAFGVWTTDLVTSNNVLMFLMGLLLLPIGFILWQSAIFRLSSHIYYHWISNIMLLCLFVVALFTIGAIYFVKWGIQDWLQWDLSFSSTALVQLFQGVYLVLTMWLTGITVFHILLRAILMRHLYTSDAQINGITNPKSGSRAEQQPLISTEMSARSSITSQDKNVQGGASILASDRMLEPDTCDASEKWFEYLSVLLFFFVFIPLFVWMNCLNVSDWHRMYPSMIISKLASTTALLDSWNIYFEFTCGVYNVIGQYEDETCYARLYYDLLYWYLFIFWVSTFSYIATKYPPLKILLRKRFYLGIHVGVAPFDLSMISVCIGEILFWIVWITMMVFIGHYFVHIHLYDETDKVTKEKWARYVGIMSIQFLTVSLFCSTRIRLWNDCFMLSFEQLVAYHRFFGVLFLLSGYIHLILWIVFWQDSGEETYGPFQVPLSYHADNFTPIIMYYVMIFVVPIVYVCGTFVVIRRKYFELFYLLHLFGGFVMISCILWHASQAWRYIIPPLALYAIDRMIRLANSSRICKVDSLSVSLHGTENDNRIEVTKLTFSVGCYSLRYGDALYKPFKFKMGQYAFIHIANVSLYEWHPFTICCGENEGECYLQIQNEGARISDMKYASDMKNHDRQFTSLVHLLAQRVDSNEVGNHEIELHVDGPYGTPFNYDGYSRVILIGGGIGITPCHSIFSTMLSRSMHFGGKDENGNTLPYVDLIWIAKDTKMFSMFSKTWRIYEDHNNAAKHKFNVRLFATKHGGYEHKMDDDHDDDDEFNHVVPETDATMYTYGRPNWSVVLSIIKHKDNDPRTTLVFCCGPQTLVNEAEKYAVKFGARFHSESFMF